MTHYEALEREGGSESLEEVQRRLGTLLNGDCAPIRELKWWTSSYGEQEGLKKLTASLISALHIHIKDYQSDLNLIGSGRDLGAILADRSQSFLETLCLWFEHIICATQLGNVLRDGASWVETTTICRQKLKGMTEAEPQRVCSRSFRAGDIVWNCKQCQKDTTCVLCQQCYRDSDHEGHDVYFYHVMTDAGGCCDCGDPGAWNPKGFCTRHGAGNNANPVQNLPEESIFSSEVVVGEVVRCIARLAKAERSQLVIEPVWESIDYIDLETVSSTNVEQLVMKATANFRPNEPQNESSIRILLKTWFTKVLNCIKTSISRGEKPSYSLQKEVEPFILTGISLQNFDSCMQVKDTMTITRYFQVVAKNIEAVRVSYFTEHLSNWLLKTLCVDSDAFTRITCHALTESPPTNSAEEADMNALGCTFLPLKDLIVQDIRLPDSCAKSLRNLYIRLLVDGLFKQRFAIAFAKTYRECSRTRIRRVPLLEMSDVDTIFGLSVQFLNRPNHVLLLVHDHDFLKDILESLAETIDSCKENIAVDGVMTSVLDLLNPILTHRKTKSTVTDLQYVLSTPGMSRYFLAEDPTFLGAWFQVLDVVYGMHEQKRIVRTEVLRKDVCWVPAFNLSLSLCSLFSDLTRYLMYGENISIEEKDLVFPNSPGKYRRINLELKDANLDHGEWCHRVLLNAMERTNTILESHGVSNSSVIQVESRFGKHPYISFNVSVQPVTFHCLLERFFAMLQAVCISSTLEKTSYERIAQIGSPRFWLSLIRQPLNALVFFAQHSAGMWNRNQDVATQAMNYQLLPFISGMFLDFRVLQVAALNLPGDVLVNYIVTSYDLIDWIGLDVPQGDPDEIAANRKSFLYPSSIEELEKLYSQGKSHEQLEKLATHMLELLCILATELPPPTPFAFQQAFQTSDITDPRIVAESDKILRREIIHSLATNRSAFRAINENCNHLKQIGVQVSANNIRRILQEVSKEISRTDGMGPIQYELKQEAWTEFDPLFHRFGREDKERARERWLQNRNSDPVDKPCFPGDLKPRTSSTRTLPLPATTSHLNIHPLWWSVREKLLLCNSTLMLVRQILVKVCREDFGNPEDRVGQGSGLVHGESTPPRITNSSTFNPTFLGNVLHLITLQIHSLRHKFGDDFLEKQTEDSASSQDPKESDSSSMPPPPKILPGSVSQYVAKFLLSKDPLYKQTPLGCLISFWYNDPRIDETNRENVRWILAQIQKMDSRIAQRIRRAYKDRKSALQAEKDKESRKRKAQRSAMRSMQLSQKSANELFAKEVASLACDERDSSFSHRLGQGTETDTKKTKLGSIDSDDDASGAFDESSLGRPSSLSISQFQRRGSTMSATVRQSNLGLFSRIVAQNQHHGEANANVGIDVEENSVPPLYSRDLGVDEAMDGTTESMDEMSAFQMLMKHALVERQMWRGPECVSCHERHRVDDGPTCYIGFRQRNDVLVREKSESMKFGFCVFWPESEGRNYVIQLCGHAIHSKCLDLYRTSIQSQPGSLSDVQKGEFFCPLCKTLSNFEIPCVPPGLVYLPKALSSDNVGVGLTEFGSGAGFAELEGDALTSTTTRLDGTIMWFARHASATTPHGDSNSPRTGNAGWRGSQLGSPVVMRSPTASSRGSVSRGSVHDFSSAAQRESDIDSYEVESPIRGTQMQKFMEFSSKNLQPVSGPLRKMANKQGRKTDVPFRDSFSFHSEQGRLRELQTTVMHNEREAHRHQFSEDPVAYIFSVALTFITEREAASFEKFQSPILSTNVVKRMRRMFEASRAFLLADGGSGMNHLNSEMFEMFSDKRSLGYHCTLHQSPEMLLILSVFRDCTAENVIQSIRATYILKLVQALLELNLEDIEEASNFTVDQSDGIMCGDDVFQSTGENGSGSSAPTPIFETGVVGNSRMFQSDRNAFGTHRLSASYSSTGAGLEDHMYRMGRLADSDCPGDSEEQVGIFQGALDLREMVLDRFQNVSPLNAHPETLSKALVDAVSGFVHIAQIVIHLADQTLSNSELKLVPREKIPVFMETKLQLPSPQEVLQHEKMMHQISDWIDQFLICTPDWTPRSQQHTNTTSPSSMFAFSPRSSLGGNVSSKQTNRTKQFPPLFKVKPLAIRPLVKLKNSYTEQYMEVHQGIAAQSKKEQEDKAICLICGEILVAGKPSNSPQAKVDDKGGCTRHTEEYHNGIGIVLLFRRSSTVLLINGSFSAYWNSLYVDENGEEQHSMPSLPMHLDRQRYHRVLRVWAENSIPAQVASLRSATSVVIRMGYY